MLGSSEIQTPKILRVLHQLLTLCGSDLRHSEETNQPLPAHCHVRAWGSAPNDQDVHSLWHVTSGVVTQCLRLLSVLFSASSQTEQQQQPTRDRRIADFGPLHELILQSTMVAYIYGHNSQRLVSREDATAAVAECWKLLYHIGVLGCEVGHGSTCGKPRTHTHRERERDRERGGVEGRLKICNLASVLVCACGRCGCVHV